MPVLTLARPTGRGGMVRLAVFRPEFLPEDDHGPEPGGRCVSDPRQSGPRRACRRPVAAALDGAMTSSVTLGTGPVSFDDVVAVARDGAAGRRSAPTRVAAIERARAVVDELAAAPTPAYGISTGFGALATRHIPTEMRAQLQRSLVRSHAAGSGPEVEREVVRGADAAAALDAGHRPHRRPPGDRAAAGRPAHATASRRWCTSTARSAAPATSPRCRTARSR